MAQTDNFRKAKSLFSTTLQTGIGTGTTDTITLGSTTGLPTDTEITLTFDRVDANGDSLGSSVERITGTISGSNLTNYTRAIDGTTEQAHSAGAVIEYIWNADDWNDAIDGILTEHNQDGTHGAVTATSVSTDTISEKTAAAGVTVDSTKLKDGSVELGATGHIKDANANELIETGQTASAVNQVKVTNAATGNAPEIAAAGDDTNIDLALAGKGTGKVKVHSSYGQFYDNGTQTTSVTFNMATSNKHIVTLGGNITLAVSNVSVGQCFILKLVQDATGSRTVTWFSTISWAGGSAPTLTTTAGQADVFGFICTGSGTYDGFVIGQNV